LQSKGDIKKPEIKINKVEESDAERDVTKESEKKEENNELLSLKVCSFSSEFKPILI
jgi:hypothetical protein